jgi:hypothetical protein
MPSTSEFNEAYSYVCLPPPPFPSLNGRRISKILSLKQIRNCKLYDSHSGDYNVVWDVTHTMCFGINVLTFRETCFDNLQEKGGLS